MKTKEELKEDLDVICNILLTITQAFDSIEHLVSLSADNIKALHPFRFLTMMRYWFWFVLIIDLNKLIANNDNQHYNFHKLLNKLINDHSRAE